MSDLPFVAILTFGKLEYRMKARQLPLEFKMPLPKTIAEMSKPAPTTEEGLATAVTGAPRSVIFRMLTPPSNGVGIYHFDGFQ